MGGRGVGMGECMGSAWGWGYLCEWVSEIAVAVTRPNGATGCSHGWSVGAATGRSPADAEPVGSEGFSGAAPVGAGELLSAVGGCRWMAVPASVVCRMIFEDRARVRAVLEAGHIDDGLRESIFWIATLGQRATLHSARD
jgi:hypothetical protein